MIILRGDLCVGLVAGPRLAVLARYEGKGQCIWPRANYKINTELSRNYICIS